MSMVENYQEEQEMKEETPAPVNFATVNGVHEDGLSLIFDSAETPSEKHYKCNQYCKFEAGQRVYLVQDSGSYVVLFPVGKPGTNVIADSAATATTATQATTSTTSTTFTSRHTGSLLGFFNVSRGAARQTVNTIRSGASTASIISGVNNLINALKAYNLIR